MAISYRLVPRKKPGTNVIKWYAQPIAQGYLSLDALAERMAAESTVTEHDVKAVLSSLQQHVVSALKDGMSVRLGDLGSFHLTFSGSGSEVRSEYTLGQHLKSVRVKFTKSGRMSSAFRIGAAGLKFRSIETGD